MKLHQISPNQYLDMNKQEKEYQVIKLPQISKNKDQSQTDIDQQNFETDKEENLEQIKPIFPKNSSMVVLK